MSIFESENYKEYFNSLLKEMPGGGYGQFKRVAAHLGVNSVTISQVFRGDRNLSAEQALELTSYLGLTELETEYFLLLVQLERAGTHKLKLQLKKQLRSLQEKSKELRNRVPQDKVLSDEAKAVFYSNWYYSGIRLLSSVEGKNTVDSIAAHLSLPRASVKRVVDFLLSHGLCIEQNGDIKMGPKTTHLDAKSELITRHHINWRLRGIQNMEPLKEEELFYTGPMALSADTAGWVREELVQLIQKIVGRVKDSNSEKLACLNIDWFDFKGREE